MLFSGHSIGDLLVRHGNETLLSQEAKSSQAPASNVTVDYLRKRAPPPIYQPWLNSPFFYNMPDVNTVNGMVTAFGDMNKLVVAALAALSNVEADGSTPANLETLRFKRYFQMDQLCLVQNSFVTLLDTQLWTFAIANLKVFYSQRPPFGGSEPSDRRLSCDAIPGLGGELFQDPGTWQSQLLLCDGIFKGPWPKSIDSIFQNNCQSIGIRADPSMNSPGAIVLHELMHWGAVSGANAFDDPRMIRDFNERGPNYDPNSNPPQGYGAYVSDPEMAWSDQSPYYLVINIQATKLRLRFCGDRGHHNLYFRC